MGGMREIFETIGELIEALFYGAVWIFIMFSFVAGFVALEKLIDGL